MCYRGNCVNSASIFKPLVSVDPCNPNPCQNGGTCFKNVTTSSLFCRCAFGRKYSGNSILLSDIQLIKICGILFQIFCAQFQLNIY
jgi:hypothetical protein